MAYVVVDIREAEELCEIAATHRRGYPGCDRHLAAIRRLEVAKAKNLKEVNRLVSRR